MNPSVTDALRALYQDWSGQAPQRIELLPQSGSDRRYYRIFAPQQTVIATHGSNIQENQVFLYFSRHFRQCHLPVPEILAVSKDESLYLQTDLGETSLLNRLEKEGFTPAVYVLFQKSLQQLAQFQVRADAGLDYEKCLTNREFGRQAILADLLYFKYYFLDAIRKPYDKQKLLNDFELLSIYLTESEYRYFMFRDFQSRNVMVSADDTIFFIDYQGGMKGAPQYDAASMIWQARANLPEEWKVGLLNQYMTAFAKELKTPFQQQIFENQYYGYVLIRLLQVLGAYGFRGLFERKAQFLASIPLALQNLKTFLQQYSLQLSTPELDKVLQLCTQEEILQHFTPPQATADTPLMVTVTSFSYRKGIPADEQGNGGGYVFDCRGIDNPGRLERFQTSTGRDKEVKDFLEQETRMPQFLNSIFDIVDITLEDYLKRNLQHLQVNFGCTGGQHRSVYAADALARHLRNKYKVRVQVTHVEQEAKNWNNTVRATS